MTNKEAAKIISKLGDGVIAIGKDNIADGCYSAEEIIIAKKIAIEALEQESTDTSTCEGNKCTKKTTELIDKLRNQKDNLYLKISDGRATYPLELILQAADAIEELSEKIQAANMERSRQYYHGGWIPVEERLPEENISYLCTIHRFEDGRTWSEELIYYPQTNTWVWREEPDILRVDKAKFAVIAWRPLPDPYREEDAK